MKRTGKEWFVSPRMCALFIVNDLCKHNWQAEKKNRMTGQERSLNQQEMECWNRVTPGAEWATFTLGPRWVKNAATVSPDGASGEGPTFHDDTPCRRSRPHCPPQNCWRLREGTTWRWQRQLWTAWTPAPYCPVKRGGELSEYQAPRAGLVFRHTLPNTAY